MTNKQKERLNDIFDFIAQNGKAPTYTKMMRMWKIKSKQTIADTISQLVKKDMLYIRKGKLCLTALGIKSVNSRIAQTIDDSGTHFIYYPKTILND